MNYEIKRLRDNDLLIAKQAVALFLDEHEIVSGGAILADLLLKDDFYFVVATNNNEIIGRLIAYEFKMYKNNTAEVYLYEIDVVGSYQNKGVGTRLIDFTKQLCKERNVSYMFVGTEEDNIAAQQLYLKTGGKLEGNMPHFEYIF